MHGRALRPGLLASWFLALHKFSRGEEHHVTWQERLLCFARSRAVRFGWRAPFCWQAACRWLQGLQCRQPKVEMRCPVSLAIWGG